MSLDPDQFRVLITKVLQQLDPYSPGGSGIFSDRAVELLMGTAAQESYFGRCIYQQGGGPGLGFFQMEPATLFSLWENYLRYNPSIIDGIATVCQVAIPSTWSLETNLAFQITMARVRYLPTPSAIPSTTDIPGLARYWDNFYNRNPNKGFPIDFERSYKRYCL